MFVLFYILVDMPMGGGRSPPPPLALLMTERVPFSEKHHVQTDDFDDHKIGLEIHREYH